MTEPFCEEYVNNKEIACGECMKDNLLFPLFFLLVLYLLPFYFQVG